MVDGEPILFEILDTCPKVKIPSFWKRKSRTESNSQNDDDDGISSVTAEHIQWADGILLVYAITDRNSFNYIRKAKVNLQPDIPVTLVGNKVDMVHLRQVSTEEGEILAKDFECKFCEISAAEHVTQVSEAFHDLCKEVLLARRKSKQSLLDRMLGGTRTYSRGKSDSALPKD